MIDKRKLKRFKLLCLKDIEFRKQYSWWRFAIIGNAPYIKHAVPRFSGDRHSTIAFREHMSDLINHYSPRVKLQCGHLSRNGHCIKCVESIINAFESRNRGILT